MPSAPLLLSRQSEIGNRKSAMPLVSLIIPTRNCRAELARLLDSIDRQTFRDFEVIVVDNENTFECGKQFS